MRLLGLHAVQAQRRSPPPHSARPLPRHEAAFTASVLRLLGVELPVTAHATLSRRGRAVARWRSRATSGGSSGPVHLVLDSTGLRLFGQGEWDAEEHGRAWRRWMRLHLAVDVITGEITAHVLTEGTAHDAAQVPPCSSEQKAPSPA